MLVRASVRVYVRVLLSDSVRECVMEGLQAGWLWLSWEKNNLRAESEFFF